MRRVWMVGLLVLAACGASAVDTANSNEEPSLEPTEEGYAPAPESGTGDMSQPDTGTDTEADAPVLDSGADVSDAQDADAPPDATPDAAMDAASEDAAPDAAPDAEPAPEDAGTEVDAEPAPEDAGTEVDANPVNCVEGSYRCWEYQKQQCKSGDWERKSGDQSCCFDPRFVVDGHTVKDTTTGLVWYRHGGTAFSVQSAAETCGILLPGGRLPTTAELLGITIGPPIDNVPVCSPTLDNTAFQNVDPKDTYTSDGCVNLTYAVSKVACSSSGSGMLCVTP